MAFTTSGQETEWALFLQVISAGHTTGMYGVKTVGDLPGPSLSEGVMMRMTSVESPGPAPVTACIQNRYNTLVSRP